MSSPNNAFDNLSYASSIKLSSIRTRYITLAVCIVTIVLIVIIGMFYYDKYAKLEDLCKLTGSCETSVIAHKWISSLSLSLTDIVAFFSVILTIATWNQTD